MKNAKRFLVILLVLVITVLPVVSAECWLGASSQVYKDLHGALKIFKIVAPLLMLGYTIFDLVKMLASGMGADGKEAPPPKQVGARFVKRLIAVLILFMLPVLVDLVFQFAGVWNEEGMCEFDETETAIVEPAV